MRLINDRDRRVLALIKSYIGKPTPTLRDMAAALDLTYNEVSSSMQALRLEGMARSTGSGNGRRFWVGDECTLARASIAAQEMAGEEAKFEPLRAERHTCPRCQTVNCTRHSAGFLTTRNIPAWRAQA